MVFTLVGWSEAQSYGAILAKIAAIADPHVRVEGNNIVVPSLNKLAGILGIGAYISDLQLDAPSLRRTALQDISKLCIAAEPTVPTPWEDLFEKPRTLDVAEPLSAAVSNSATASTTRVSVLAFLSDGKIEPVPGEIFTVRASAGATLTPYTWTNAALTFRQTLPAGKYAVVGMRAQSDGLIAARLVFPGSPWRPGCIGFDTMSDVDVDRFRMGKAGVWGIFDHVAPPTVDFLSSSADTSEIVWLDLVKVG
jgi:hypothetical protein